MHYAVRLRQVERAAQIRDLQTRFLELAKSLVETVEKPTA
jgi:hypothetical protein